MPAVARSQCSISLRHRQARGHLQLTGLQSGNQVVDAEPVRFGQLRTKSDGRILGDRGETEHDRCRKRPRLRGMIIASADTHAGFLEHLAAHRVFEAFARLDEARERREPPFRPLRPAPEQTTIAVSDDDDDRRVGAREMLYAALWIRTLRPMPGRLQRQRCCAGRAVARALLPVREPARVREQAGLERRQRGAGAAQVEELATSGCCRARNIGLAAAQHKMIARVRAGSTFTLRSYGADGRLLAITPVPAGPLPTAPSRVSGWF